MSEENVKTVGDKRVLYVMAAPAEYGAALKRQFQPLFCGVGPVEAALNTSRALQADQSIDLVVSLGSAGSKNLLQAQVYQVSSVAYRDMDASPFGFEPGQTPFLDLPPVVKLDRQVAGIPAASLSTGANVVSGDAYDGVPQDMVDMETWAILRATMMAGVPLVGLRGISDGAEPVAEYADWTRYLEVIDQRLSVAVDILETGIKSGDFTI